ncbi:hypothetical protein CLOP_g10374 [Closterium sp. NIES-67]|nr:hypothetical protein CLOP_g10374 [Closterium sp. NIES-67]
MNCWRRVNAAAGAERLDEPSFFGSFNPRYAEMSATRPSIRASNLSPGDDECAAEEWGAGPGRATSSVTMLR